MIFTLSLSLALSSFPCIQLTKSGAEIKTPKEVPQKLPFASLVSFERLKFGNKSSNMTIHK